MKERKFSFTKNIQKFLHALIFKQPTPTRKNSISSKIWMPEYPSLCLKRNDITSQDIFAGPPLEVSVGTVICWHWIKHYATPWEVLIPINQKFYLNATDLFGWRQSCSESDLSRHIPLILSSMSSVNTVFEII